MVNSSDSLKMFWEVWRNVTSATTNWSLGGGNGGGGGTKKGLPSSSSSSAHKTRYNRLNGPPTKSQSQPANLTSLQQYSSSSESLTGAGDREDDDVDIGQPIPPLPLLLEEGSRDTQTPRGKEQKSSSRHLGDLVGLESQFTPLENGNNDCSNLRKSSSSKKNGMKHSFSSFFPFTSCATPSSPPSVPASAAAASTTTSNRNIPGKSDLDQHQQKQQSRYHPQRKGSSACAKATATSSMTNGNGGDIEAGCWDHNVNKKEMGTGINNENDEEDISDLDDIVESLTCDVCERCFPTLRQLAAHQRKKRHYGCLQCDSIFPSREVLECHREQMCHYDYAINAYNEDEDEENFFESDDDEHGLRDEEDCDDEERERLL